MVPGWAEDTDAKAHCPGVVRHLQLSEGQQVVQLTLSLITPVGACEAGVGGLALLVWAGPLEVSGLSQLASPLWWVVAL